MLLSTSKNCLGTAELVIKGNGMRKEQSFSVYPINITDSDKRIKIQSDTRFGYIDLDTGVMSLTKSRSGGSYGVDYVRDFISNKLVETKFSKEDLKKIKEAVRLTSGDKVGDRGIVCDNGGASAI